MTTRPQTTDEPLFPAVVCGIDGTRQSFEAARQAARLLDDGGRLVLVAATHFLDAVSGRWGPERLPWDRVGAGERDVEALTEAVRAMAHRSLEWAERQVGGSVAVERRVVSGRAFEELPREAERAGANLIAIGAHGGRRLVGAALGSVASMLLHDAPTSVLVARAPFDPGAYPSRIAVGVDGSQAAAAALAVARRLGRDAEADLTVVAATGGGEVDLEEIRGGAGAQGLTVDGHRPVDALLDVATRSDLLVVGSRGLGGVRALGSVSERVAHRAESSVLVVRA